MDIKNRIKRISPYFKEMQIVPVDDEQMIYVLVNFPKNWVVDEDIIETKYNTSIELGETPEHYYFFTEIENESSIFDAIEYTIEKMKDAFERAKLLTEKVNELKEIFQNENNTLEELRNLSFNYKKNDISLLETDDLTLANVVKTTNENELITDTVQETPKNETEKISKKNNKQK